MEELKIDWPAWGQRAKTLLLSASTGNHNITLAPGVLLCKGLETSYGSGAEMMALKLGAPTCFRRSYANFPREEVEGASDSWEDRLRDLWLYALLGPVQVQGQQEAVDFQANAPPAVFWMSETVFAYVPEDHFFRAFAAAEKDRREHNPTPQEAP